MSSVHDTLKLIKVIVGVIGGVLPLIGVFWSEYESVQKGEGINTIILPISYAVMLFYIIFLFWCTQKKIDGTFKTLKIAGEKLEIDVYNLSCNNLIRSQEDSDSVTDQQKKRAYELLSKGNELGQNGYIASRLVEITKKSIKP